MRLALILVLAVGCAKKQPAPKAAAPPAENAADAPAETGAPAPDDAKKDSAETKGDPCDGGETKNK